MSAVSAAISPAVESIRADSLHGTYLRVVLIGIGGVAIALRTSDAGFAEMVKERYGSFASARIASDTDCGIAFDIELLDLPVAAPYDIDLESDIEVDDDELAVTRESGVWHLRRGDFSAAWNSQTGLGTIRLAPNPYSLDSVLRIVHSLVLARRGEFLVHAASAIRNGHAFLFAGISGAGKTTISRLAPPDATLLTDEISYVRRDRAENGSGYVAWGTPFAGELATVGANCFAPLRAVYLLRQGSENRIDEIPPSLAAQGLLRNILFFAQDAGLVRTVFEGACEFVERVPVRQLTFRMEAAVWDLIQ